MYAVIILVTAKAMNHIKRIGYLRRGAGIKFHSLDQCTTTLLMGISGIEPEAEKIKTNIGCVRKIYTREDCRTKQFP